MTNTNNVSKLCARDQVMELLKGFKKTYSLKDFTKSLSASIDGTLSNDITKFMLRDGSIEESDVEDFNKVLNNTSFTIVGDDATIKKFSGVVGFGVGFSAKVLISFKTDNGDTVYDLPHVFYVPLYDDYSSGYEVDSILACREVLNKYVMIRFVYEFNEVFLRTIKSGPKVSYLRDIFVSELARYRGDTEGDKYKSVAGCHCVEEVEVTKGENMKEVNAIDTKQAGDIIGAILNGMVKGKGDVSIKGKLELNFKLDVKANNKHEKENSGETKTRKDDVDSSFGGSFAIELDLNMNSNAEGSINGEADIEC